MKNKKKASSILGLEEPSHFCFMLTNAQNTRIREAKKIFQGKLHKAYLFEIIKQIIKLRLFGKSPAR